MKPCIELSFHRCVKKLILIISLFFFSYTSSFGQNAGQGFMMNLVAKLQNYQSDTGDRRIYLHTDKVSYHPGEMVFFQGYILDFYTSSFRFGGDSLRVEIAGDAGSSLVSKNFLIENSVVSGYLQLPALVSGSYQLVAYSQKLTGNGVGKVFIRPLVIEKDSELNLSIQPCGDFFIAGKTFQYEVTASIQGVPAAGTSISFKTENGGKTIKGSEKTDKTGKALITIEMPKNQAVGSILEVDGKYAKQTKTIFYPMEYDKTWIKAAFSPEGGRLIAGNSTSLKGIVTDIFGGTVLCQATLISSRGEKILLNEKSKGLFEGVLTPVAGNTYSVQLTLPGGSTREVSLPAVEENGVMLSLISANPQQIDFKLSIPDPSKITGAVLVGYMHGKLISSSALQGITKEMTFHLNVGELDPGVAHFAVIDSAGKLYSERSVFIPKTSPSIVFHQPFSGKYEFTGQVSLPADLSVSVSNRDKKDPGIFSSLYVLPEIPQSFYPVLRLQGQDALSEELINDILVAGKLFSWTKVINEEKNNITDIQQTLALKTVWVAMVQPFLLNNFRSLENAFSDHIQESAKTSKSPDIKKKEYYSQYSTVLDIIKSIKMFDLINNKIVFSGGINTIYGPDGALIVIDGNKMGTDVSVLNSLNTSEIENVEVSTKAQDVMQYTALDAVGIVKIKTLGSGNIERYPNIVPSGQVVRKSFSPTPESLWWNTFVLSSQSLAKPVEFLPGERKGSYLIRMEGIAADGKLLWGEKEITIE